jgi:hypothetical protein
MFLDQENLRPVIIAMALYIAISVLIPRIIKKPTGIQPIDDLVMTIIAQKDSLMSGTILIGIVVLATNYIQDELL